MKTTEQVTASELNGWASTSSEMRHPWRPVKARARSRLSRTFAKRRVLLQHSWPGKAPHVNFSSEALANSCVAYPSRLLSERVSKHRHCTSAGQKIFSSSGPAGKLCHLVRQPAFRGLPPTHGPAPKKLANGEKQYFHELNSEDVGTVAVAPCLSSVFRCAARQPTHETDDEKGGNSCSSMCRPACACRPSLLSAHYLSKLLRRTIFDPSANLSAYRNASEFLAAIVASRISRSEGPPAPAVPPPGEAKRKEEDSCPGWRALADHGYAASRLEDLKGTAANQPEQRAEPTDALPPRRAFEEHVSSSLATYREVPLFLMSAEHHLSPEWLSQFIPTQDLLDVLEPEVRLTRPERASVRQRRKPVSMLFSAKSGGIPTPDSAPSFQTVQAAKKTDTGSNSPEKVGAQAGPRSAAADGIRRHDPRLTGGASARKRVVLVDNETREQSGLDSRYLRRIRAASLVLARRGQNGVIDAEPLGSSAGSAFRLGPLHGAAWLACGSGPLTGETSVRDEAEAVEGRGEGGEGPRPDNAEEAAGSAPDGMPVHIIGPRKAAPTSVSLVQSEHRVMGILDRGAGGCDVGAVDTDAEIVVRGILGRMTAPYLCIP